MLFVVHHRRLPESGTLIDGIELQFLRHLYHRLRIVLIFFQLRASLRQLEQGIDSAVREGCQPGTPAIRKGKIRLLPRQQLLPLIFPFPAEAPEDSFRSCSHQSPVLHNAEIHTAGSLQRQKGLHSPLTAPPGPQLQFRCKSSGIAQTDHIPGRVHLLTAGRLAALQYPSILSVQEDQGSIRERCQSSVLQNPNPLYHLIASPLFILDLPFLWGYLQRLGPFLPPEMAFIVLLPCDRVSCKQILGAVPRLGHLHLQPGSAVQFQAFKPVPGHFHKSSLLLFPLTQPDFSLLLPGGQNAKLILRCKELPDIPVPQFLGQFCPLLHIPSLDRLLRLNILPPFFGASAQQSYGQSPTEHPGNTLFQLIYFRFFQLFPS